MTRQLKNDYIAILTKTAVRSFFYLKFESKYNFRRPLEFYALKVAKRLKNNNFDYLSDSFDQNYCITKLPYKSISSFDHISNRTVRSI